MKDYKKFKILENLKTIKAYFETERDALERS